jgi:Hypervirulence associated proteins TUDOR domain
MTKIKVGKVVNWKWLNGVAEGKVIAINYEKTQIESKGKIITRNGTKENPAIIIKHKNSNLVLKLETELLK